MTYRRELAMRFLEIAKEMKHEALPPSEEISIDLTQTQYEMAATALLAVEAIEIALAVNRP